VVRELSAILSMLPVIGSLHVLPHAILDGEPVRRQSLALLLARHAM
jgi:hypothetical protein